MRDLLVHIRGVEVYRADAILLSIPVFIASGLIVATTTPYSFVTPVAVSSASCLVVISIAIFIDPPVER